MTSQSVDVPLPRLPPGFAWSQTPSGPALVCRPLEAVAPHIFTTRPWRLGLPSGLEGDAGWDEVARAMGVGASRLARVRQVHGAACALVDRESFGRPDADIVLAGAFDVVVAVQTADCVPLLMADQRTGAVAAAHAGWRGLAARAPEAAVRALEHQCGCRAVDLVVAAGPSIGACCYEVGAEVRDRFRQAGFGADDLARWFQRDPAPTSANPSMPCLSAHRRPDHWFFDSWAAARDGLRSAGVPAAQISVAEVCTASHPAWCCSFRRDGGPAGRMAAAIRVGRPRP
jgi:YfiH family protein